MLEQAGDSSDAGMEQMLEFEQRSRPWISDMFTCFSSVITRMNDFQRVQELPWELPFDSLTRLSYLGAGAQGVVFTGMLNGEMVAIKKVRSKLETSMKHLRKLNHENVVRFRGVCTKPPCFCVVMEYCQYGSLYKMLHSENKLLPEQLLKWAKEISRGMAYLHGKKIIHRDLKSPNILLSDDLVVKVSDFGTSCEWQNTSTTMSFNGTVGWMAPEVIRHDRCSDRVDVWAFGVVLWEMMTRKQPFTSIEPHAVLWGVGSDTLALPLPSGCPQPIQLLISQCWQRNPKSRPPFKLIVANLELATPEFEALNPQTFAAVQASWGADVMEKIHQIHNKDNPSTSSSVTAPGHAGDIPKGKEVLIHVKEIYENHMRHANDLFMEVCSVRLQLEQRECYVSEMEVRLKNCHCSQMPNPKKEAASTSSDAIPVIAKQPRKKKPEAKLLVRYDAKEKSTYTVAVKDNANKDDAINKDAAINKDNATNKGVSFNKGDNFKKHDIAQVHDSGKIHDSVKNNNVAQKKDTIVEQNGNVVMPKKGKGKQKKKSSNKSVPDVAFI